ncbi:MAG: hypothetical protein QOH56_3730 [Pseudonocardiales bacterium]|jgi:hypothetical protein|nr:hypothetical protein [Pseudonocardiales bacterium]
MVEISRRTLLSRTVLVAAAAAGTGLGVTRTVHHRVALPPTPPPQRLTALLSTQVRLLTGYQRAVTALPDQAARLDPLRGDVAAHGDALRGLLENYPGWRLNPTLPPAGASSAPAVVATVAGLTGASKAAAAAFSAACLTWPVTEQHASQIVPMLGSISACLDTHGQVLS